MHKSKNRRQAAPSKLILAFALFAAACSSASSPEREEARKRMTPEYDKNGRLHLLRYDSNGDSRPDMWSYMDGAKVQRIDIDSNYDGKIDRWEYYDTDQKLEKVGFSRLNDGVQDAWSFGDGSGAITRIDVSTRRDGLIGRIEHYENGKLVRAEEDTTGAGGWDKWETYDGDRLASVAFDTLHRGKPDRRLNYVADGSVVLEVDPEGDGTFVPANQDQPAERVTRQR